MTAAMQGKVVLVTGGAKRLGAAIARTLHAAGASIAIHYHLSAGEARALAAELNAARAGSAAIFGADLLDLAAIDALVAATVAHFGRLDALVNNASTFYPTPVGSITPAQWEDLVGTNLRAPLFLAQAAAPHLRASHGLILNIADIHGMKPLREHVVYSPAKAGLIMLTQSLARELAPEVRVNAIAPSPVDLPDDAREPGQVRRIIERTPLQRLGTAADIAGAALYFATAPYVTGQVLAVDGGRSIST